MLGWLLRAIVLTILVNLIVRLIFSSARSTHSTRRERARGPAPGRASRAERTGGTLVQDPQCGMYIVPARAIRAGSGHDAHYFCSDGCRAAYLAAHPQ